MSTLEQLYDTNLDFYARVNFTSLIDIVDALGGVDVDSEYAFTTSNDSGLVMNVVQGTNLFNGKQALAFSRERQNVPGGDNQRGKDQQAVLTAMIKKMVSPAILTGAKQGAKRQAVCLNAGAALYIAGKAETIEKGVRQAEQLLDSGAALAKLEEFIRESNSEE